MMPEPDGFTHSLRHGPRALARRAAAAAAVRAYPLDASVLVLAPSPEAGSRVLRQAAEGQPGAFGYQRLTPSELANRLAAAGLAAAGRAPVSPIVLEAQCAREVHALREAGRLGRFAGVGERPGLPRVLARAFGELGLADVGPDHPSLEPDLRRLFAAYRRALAEHGLADRADVLRAAAARAADAAPHPLLDRPLIVLDVPVRHALEQALLRALAARAPVAALVPSGDAPTLERLGAALDAAPEPLPEAPPRTALERARGQLFGEVQVSAPLDPTVEVLSAPGESRECVELVRRALSAAREGVPFDRMAILTHEPERYRAHLVEALGRARVPAHFSKGAIRPDPSGRALLALLACREEGLSARAFGEYLSLGVVPDDEAGAPPSAEREVPWEPPPGADLRDDEAPEAPAPAPRPLDADAPVAEGSLRAPWRWERLLVDAAVVGGAARWRRRLDGLDAALARRAEGRAPGDEDDDEPSRAAAARKRRDLAHLRAFALPLIEELDALPERATWGEWAARLAALATRALREPAHTLAVLRELGPMGPIGPVGLSEVRLVLSRRLTDMRRAPSGAPAGKLWVGSTDEARGLSFARVFVLGLAERGFPRKIIGDPILRDAARQALHAGLATRATRVADERLALRVAVGAAEERLVLSYPRMDTARGRPRVPSFYALEVLRAVEGRLPTFEELATRAEAASGARLAWPAPDAPEEAIDDAEYDLAVLRELLDPSSDQGAGGGADGGARYLLDANEHLARSLRQRWARWDSPKWTSQDGLVSTQEEVRAALAAHRPGARAYSATALEQLARCPYRFYLRAVLGLTPAEPPEALEELDPRARGTLIHAIQFDVLGRLRGAGALPLTEARLPAALEALDAAVEAQAARFAEELAPAVERVWDDAVADVRADLAEWLHRLAARPDWVPVQFELAFGLPLDARHDPGSVAEPVALSAGLSLRGAIDLVERRAEPAGAQGATLRATDHKTGAARSLDGVVGGGKVLQPVLYALALEALHPGATVHGGRLYYCTARGGFEERPVRLTSNAREAVGLLTDTLDGLVGDAFLPALPERGECARCDYRAVCGPAEERRVERKKARHPRLVALNRLRRLP